MSEHTKQLEDIVLPMEVSAVFSSYFKAKKPSPLIWFKSISYGWNVQLRSNFTEEAIEAFSQEGKIVPAYTFQECNQIMVDVDIESRNSTERAAAELAHDHWCEVGCLFIATENDHRETHESVHIANLLDWTDLPDLENSIE